MAQRPLPDALPEPEPETRLEVVPDPVEAEVEEAEVEVTEPQTADPLKLYVRQIGDGRLLTPAEERELARLKDEGNEAAKRKLIESNLRLVMSITRNYTKAGVPLLDLIQEGNLGLIRDVDRQPDRPALVGKRARHCLADPPGRVGRKLVAELVVEFLHRSDQSEVPLLDQIQKRHASLRVVAGDRHDEPEVALDQPSLGGLVALVLAPGELPLLGRRQQPPVADLTNVELEWVVGARPGELRPFPRLGLVRHRGLLTVSRVEKMFGGVAFHGACIGSQVAPLEG